MNKFMKLVEIEDGKFNPIGFIYEHTADFSEERCFLLCKRKTNLLLIKFKEVNQKVEILSIDENSNNIMDLKNKQFISNSDYEYDFSLFENTSYNITDFFNEKVYSHADVVSKQDFLEAIGFSDLDEQWNSIFSAIRKSGITPNQFSKILNQLSKE